VRREDLKLLVDPLTKAPLDLDRIEEETAGDVVEGSLRSGPRVYWIRNGIARFVDAPPDAAQSQTQQSFAYKWQRQDTYGSQGMHAMIADWLVQKYGFGTLQGAREYFAGRRRILDAGCGGGLTTSTWMTPGWQAGGDAEWFGADISEAIDVARDRLGSHPGTHFVQADVLRLPFRAGAFDTVFAEGVLHHTPSTRAALEALIGVLAVGGDALFYVYRTKAPLREFADDWIRTQLSPMPADEAWAALRPLTALAESLGRMRATVAVPDDIPYLGIRAGTYDLQRFMYWHVLKLFWNESFTFEENNHVNFDWYHPRYAHRQSEDDVRTWCAELGLRIVHMDVQEAGITVRAVKDAGSAR